MKHFSFLLFFLTLLGLNGCATDPNNTTHSPKPKTDEIPISRDNYYRGEHLYGKQAAKERIYRNTPPTANRAPRPSNYFK